MTMAKPKTKPIKQEICRLLALGNPIQNILENDIIKYPDKMIMPSWDNVVEWIKSDELFRNDYEQARIYGADYLADDMLCLVKMLRDDPKKAPAARAAMEILKWQTMVRNSKYSEKIVQETKNVGPLDPDKVREEIARLQKEL